MNEERGDGEGIDSQTLSDTLRHINLAGLDIGLVVLCGPMNLCVCVREESGDGKGVVLKHYQIHLDTSISPIYP